MRLLNVFCLSLLLILPGCGGGDLSHGRVPVSGKITLDGDPLEKGTIRFIDANGKMEGIGIIERGYFEVRQTANSAGILPGEYRIGVESWEVEPGSVSPAGDIIAQGKRAIDEKFSKPEQSGLTATVPDKGTSSLTLELKSGS